MHFCDTNVTVTIRLCPESFSVCLGSSCVRLMGRIFFGLLGSCALAWAVKEVPDSEAGPPAAELPRHTDIDPFAQGEARKARAQSLRCQCRFAGVRLHPNPLAIRRVGSMVDRSIRRKESGEEAPTMRVSWQRHASPDTRRKHYLKCKKKASAIRTVQPLEWKYPTV